MELLGVYDVELVEPLAKVLANLGIKNAMVVHGLDGLDEISMSAPTALCEVKDGWLKSYEITPEPFGLARCEKSDLAGGSPTENAEILRAVLDGQKGPKRDASVLNAAAALYIAGKAKAIQDGVTLAQEIIDSKKAKKKLEEFITYSSR
jgi:anthranilate phosphoribosyltransferase